MDALAPRRHTCPGKGSFNHLGGGIDHPELKIIDAFIRKLCKNFAKTRESRNFSETVRAAPRDTRAACDRRAHPA